MNAGDTQSETRAAEETPPSTMDAKMKRLVYIAVGVVLLLLVVILVLVIILSVRSAQDSRDSCEPLKEIPQASSFARHEPVASSDAYTLADLSGYIHLYDVGFLPFRLDYVQHEMSDKTPTTSRGIVKLVSDCATVQVDYHSENFQQSICPSGIRLKDLDDREICQISPNHNAQFPEDQHYSCPMRKVYLCYSHNYNNPTPVAELIIESLQLELDGNPDSIRRGEFSKKAFNQSCYWRL